MISAAAIAPGKEPIVPRTMTAKEGSNRKKCSDGFEEQGDTENPPADAGYAC